jgi:hypothetical protein
VKIAAPLDAQLPFASNGLVAVQRVSVQGAWVAYCVIGASDTATESAPPSARDTPGSGAAHPSLSTPSKPSTKGAVGDAELRLHWADAREQSISAVLGESPDGRAVALATAQGWQLFDTASGRSFDLTALGVDQRFLANATDARSLAFHPTEPLVAVLLRGAQPATIVVLDYARGAQVRVNAVSAEVVRMAWDATGEYLLLDEIPADTNANQRLDWPEPELAGPPKACAVGRQFVVKSNPGDRSVRSIASKLGGIASLAPDAELHTPRGWISLGASHAALLDAGATHAALTPADCEAHRVATHRAQMLVGCLAKSRLTLGLVSAAGFRDLRIDMPYAEVFSELAWRERFLPLYAGATTYLVDFERGNAITLNERDQLLAQERDFVVVRRGSTLVRRHVLDGTESVLAEDIASGARLITSAKHAYVEPYVVGANPAFAAYQAPKSVVALSGSGCVLTFADPADALTLRAPAGAKPLPQSSVDRSYVRGPLRWVCGKPSAADNALTIAVTEENRVSGSMASDKSTQASTFAGSSGRSAVKRGRGAVVAAR